MTELDIGVYGARGVPSTYSGYETFLTAFLPELVTRGHSVTMYCRRSGPDRPRTYRGVRNVYLPSIETKQLSTMTHGMIASIAARAHRHDVVLAVNVANAPFCALARYTGQPIVLNTDGQEWLRGKWGRVARSYFLRSARIASRSANALVADSIGMAEIYAAQFGARSTVIPYPWTALPVPAEPTVLREHGLVAGRFVCLAGRLIPENNAVPLVESYLAGTMDWPFVVLGEANYDSPVERRLRSLASGDARLRLLGHVSDRSSFASIIGSAGVYLHGHSVGGINPSLVEAMGSRALIVALDTVFNREALGDAGWYFADFDEELRHVIEHVATLPVHAGNDMRAKARTRALELFDLDRITSAYEDLLIRVAERKLQGGSMRTEWSVPPVPVREQA